ncbi:hypothetical protein TcG_09068 [Trypanosoma cruzi]|nr:hypothetical protein TcG_09068 [Trypanosoma cruzi]
MRWFYCVLTLAVTLLPLLAHGEVSWGGYSSRMPHIGFGRITAVTAGAAVETRGNLTLREDPQPLSWKKKGVVIERIGEAEEYSYHIPNKNDVISVTVEAGSRHLLEFTGEADNMINIVAQLLDSRYDENIQPSNCLGLYINVEIRVKDESDEGGKSSDVWSSESGSKSPRRKPVSPWSSFWNAIATILDSSAFCDILPTVMMRVAPTPVPTVYQFIISARHGYAAPVSNYKCQMRVFIEQDPAEEMTRMQNVFGLALPLAFLFLTAPFVLWRIDLLPGYLVDIDVVNWLWYMPYLLRDTFVNVAVGCGTTIWGLYKERRSREYQRRLEEQRRRLMEEAQSLPSMHEEPTPFPSFQPQPQPGTFAAADVGFMPAGGNNNNNNNNHDNSNGNNPTNDCSSGGSSGFCEKERRDSTVVHILPPPPPHPGTTSTSPAAAAETVEALAEARGEEVDVITRKKQNKEERQKLLNNREEFEVKPQSSVSSSPTRVLIAASNLHYRHGNKDKDASAASGPRELLETSAPCVVHVHTSAVEMQEGVIDELAEDGNNRYRKNPSSESRAFLYKEEEQEEEENVCRICRDGEEEEKLVSACECTGSVRWVHRTCLDRWRMESAKRNMRNVNRCEICKKPFNISIRRRTLLWQSSRHLVLGVTLALSSVVFFFAITVFLRKTLGTISCRAPWRSVSYTTMFNLDGIMLTLFGYFMLVLLATFAFALVYSRWHTREEIEAHVQEFQALPEFWTFRNTTKVVAVYVIGIGQALCLGYLMKLWIYRTSNVVWNWEASPSIGAVLYMTFLTLGMSAVRAGREFFYNQSLTNASDIVVVDQQQEQQQQNEEERAEGNVDSQDQTPPTIEGSYETSQVVAVPPHLRPIRAMEYCPRRPVGRT